MATTFTFSVSAGLTTTADTPGFPRGRLEAITNAFGRLMESLMGRPTTQVYQDFGIDDVTLFVDTTLGYPEAGQVWAGEYLVTYLSKTAGAFVGCSSRARSKILGRGLLVTLYTPSAPPA